MVFVGVEMSHIFISYILLLEILYFPIVIPCPSTDYDWELKINSSTCKDNKKYHCFCGMDGQFKENCFDPKVIQRDFCVIGFEEGVFGSEVPTKVNCTGICPTEKYLSYVFYKYEGCRNLIFNNSRCTVSMTTGVKSDNISTYYTSDVRSTIWIHNTVKDSRFILPQISTIVLATSIAFILIGVSIALYCARKRINEKSTKQSERTDEALPRQEFRNNYDDSWELRDLARVIRNNEMGDAIEFEEEDLYDHLKSKRVNLNDIMTDNY